MFVESYESEDIRNAKEQRKQFIERLKKDVDPRSQRIMNILNDTEAVKKDWETVGKDFQTI